MNTEVKQKLDELRIKLKQQCNSINEMAIKNTVKLMDDDVQVEACDSGIFLKKSKTNSQIFVKSEDIPDLVKVLTLFI
jgi:putative ubiquitin-RnfH superfamily antitoxin RatB of RatAB toxin-antitoxin module